MYCPRCGAESKEGTRYCASCGHELPDGSADASSGGSEDGLRAGIKRVVGRDRKARLVTLGTLAAVVIAVVAFLALDTGEDEATVPQDAYSRALDTACVQHKREIAAAQERALQQGGIVAAAGYAEAFVPIVGEWRNELDEVPIPSDRTELVGDLQGALLEVQLGAGTFARVLREEKKAGAATAAGDLEAATENVEVAIAGLDLERCSRLAISQGRLVGK